MRKKNIINKYHKVITFVNAYISLIIPVSFLAATDAAFKHLLKINHDLWDYTAGHLDKVGRDQFRDEAGTVAENLIYLNNGESVRF